MACRQVIAALFLEWRFGLGARYRQAGDRAAGVEATP